MEILLIDDEIDVCETLKSLLEGQGYRVSYATSGEAAVNDVTTADLVICDLNLQGENGLEVIERLQALRPDVKVLVLTGEPTIDRLQRAIDLGVAGFVTKLEGNLELLASVDRTLGLTFGSVFLFPSSLKETLAEALPYLGEVATADGDNWAVVRNHLRTADPTCVLVDGAAPTAQPFLQACGTELEGRLVFLLFRESDFKAARAALGHRPGIKCLEMPTSPGQLLRALRDEVLVRRRAAERMRDLLAATFERCPHAAPLRMGYYCTLAGACPYGEVKLFPVTVRGNEYARCPRRPLVVPNPDRVALLTWRGAPDAQALRQYRAEAQRQLGQGKTHVIVDGAALRTLPFELVQLLMEIETALKDRAEARIDVVNLAPRVLAAAQNLGEVLRRTAVYPRVLIELPPVHTSPAFRTPRRGPPPP